MSCLKYVLTNTGSTSIFFNYQRCSDAMWEYQIELKPNQTKNVWLLNNTFSSPYQGSSNFILQDEGVFPPVFIAPTPSNSSTPANTSTPTITPTQTITPSETSDNTPTPTPTETETPTPTPTETEIPTPTPTLTPTETETPTPTPTPTETETPTPTPTPTETETPTPTPTLTSTPLFKEIVFRYDAISYVGACANSKTTYYLNPNVGDPTSAFNILYTDSSLTSIAPEGYYIVDTIPYCLNTYGSGGYFVDSSGFFTSSIGFNPCPGGVNFNVRYKSSDIVDLCSQPFKFLRTTGTTTPVIGKIYYQQNPCVPATDGYYSTCNCSNGIDYFVISGGTGEVVDIVYCPTSTPTPTPTETETPTPTPTPTETETPTPTPNPTETQL